MLVRHVVACVSINRLLFAQFVLSIKQSLLCLTASTNHITVFNCKIAQYNDHKGHFIVDQRLIIQLSHCMHWLFTHTPRENHPHLSIDRHCLVTNSLYSHRKIFLKSHPSRQQILNIGILLRHIAKPTLNFQYVYTLNTKTTMRSHGKLAAHQLTTHRLRDKY